MRTNNICIYVGKRGSGKTAFVKNLIDIFPQPKTLIVDIFDNPEWQSMKTYNHPDWEFRKIPIYPSDKLAFLEKQSSHKILRTFSSDIEFLEAELDAHVRNTSVIVEDCSRWFNSTLTKSQKRYLLNCKQTNCDVHLFFHTLTSVPKELVKYADWITIFKTGEVVFDKTKYPIVGFANAFDLVNKSKDRFINKTIRIQ